MAEPPSPHPMDPGAREEVRRILAGALQLPSLLRKAYLDEHCADDASLRAEVESLLATSDETALVNLGTDHTSAFEGTRVGPYQIMERIGEGGMGAVYKAIDTRLDRTVALKVISPAHRGWLQERRFAREAKAASALNHPNIVTIYEFDTRDEVNFIAMEYVQGASLLRLLERPDVPLKDLLEYARQAAGAIGKAHDAGIVHRDLKPGNIMVTAEGVAKVLDFGLAKQNRADGDPDSDATRTQSLTQAGVSVGTPSYMSPEQAIGEAEDRRSDIFSFGIILYEIACRRRPFQGTTVHATMYQIVHEQPPEPGALNPEVSPPLAALIDRCLRKKREERPQSMAEVAEALTEILREPERKPRPSRRLWLVGALALAAIAVAAALWLPKGPALGYAIEAQHMRDGQPEGEPYTAAASDTFQSGWRFRLRLKPARSGFLYVISAGDPLWVVYPSGPGASMAPAKTEVVTGWYVFDQTAGTEHIWIVWAGKPIEVVEKTLRQIPPGRVESQATAGTIQQLLAGLRDGSGGQSMEGQFFEVKHQ